MAPPRQRSWNGWCVNCASNANSAHEEKAEKKRWVRNVKTVSTYPPERLFTKDARTIAQTMASPRVSPKGIGSGIRMIQFFMNRAGKKLPPERRKELEKAKRILQTKIRARNGRSTERLAERK